CGGSQRAVGRGVGGGAPASPRARLRPGRDRAVADVVRRSGRDRGGAARVPAVAAPARGAPRPLPRRRRSGRRVARRRSAGETDRGGDGIPAQRNPRAGLRLRAATVVAASGLAVYPVVLAPRLGVVLAIVGGIAVGVL